LDLQEFGHLELDRLACRLKAKEARLAICVDDRLNIAVLVVIDEALLELLELSVPRLSLVHHLDVLAATDLPSLGDTLTTVEGSHFVIVDIAVILACLPDESLCSLVRLHQEYFFDLEDLFLTSFRNLHIDRVLALDQQELFVKGLRDWKPNRVENTVDHAIDFILEALPFYVVNDMERWVASPSIDQLFVQDLRFFDALVTSFVVLTGVKLHSSISSRLHVDHALISPVAQLYGAPRCLVEECLPDLLGNVGLSVHDTSVANQDCFLVRTQGHLEEDIFEDHLELHEINLELDSVGESHLSGLNEAATLHHQRGCFWHHKDLEALCHKFLLNCRQRSRLARTWATGQANPRYLVLGLRDCLCVVMESVLHPALALLAHLGRSSAHLASSTLGRSAVFTFGPISSWS